MSNKKSTLPFILIGAGAVAAAIALWPKSSNTEDNNSNQAQQTSSGNIFDKLIALVSTITTGTNTIIEATKSSGNVLSVARGIYNGSYYAQLVTGAIVNNLKAGNTIAITVEPGTDTTYSGNYKVLAVNGIYITINKPYSFAGTCKGTYKEI